MSLMRCYKLAMHLKGSQLNFYLLRATRAHDAIALFMPSVLIKTRTVHHPAPLLVSCNHMGRQKSTTLPPVPGLAHIRLLSPRSATPPAETATGAGRWPAWLWGRGPFRTITVTRHRSRRPGSPARPLPVATCGSPGNGHR